MKKIYTKTGDQGTTSLRGGERVEKDDVRIEANGTLDELNASLGIVRAMLPASHPWQKLLLDIQQELMTVMSHVATPDDAANPKPLHLAELTLRCEQEMDSMLNRAEAPSRFVVPGKSMLEAQLHMARTLARRAERRLWTLHRQHAQNPSTMQFINRLSDLLFVMATHVFGS